MPLAEVQSNWISKYLLGEDALPTPEQMTQAIQHERKVMRKRYGNSPRHTIQVDFMPYVRGVQKELQRGIKRPKQAPLLQHAAQAAEAASQVAR